VRVGFWAWTENIGKKKTAKKTAEEKYFISKAPKIL
jgi:hypothetical protein